MTNVLRVAKRAFTWSVVMLTIASSVGLSALVANAAVVTVVNPSDVNRGDLIQVSGASAVYYITQDMERQFFLSGTYFGTYNGTDFSMVKHLPALTDLDQYFPSARRPLVGPRAGSVLLKSTVSPRVWVMSCDATVRPIMDPAVAAALVGANWESKIADIDEVFLALFNHGTILSDATPYCGQLVQFVTNGPVYQVGADNMYHPVDGTLPSYVMRDVLSATAAQQSALAMSTVSVTAASVTTVTSSGAPVVPPTTTSTLPSGNVGVTLSANTPAPRLVPGGTAFNQVLKFDVRSDVSTNITGVRIHKTGFAANTAVAGLLIYDGMNKKHGNTVSSINSDANADLLFNNEPIALVAGVPQTLTVLVHTAGTTGDLQFSVTSITTANNSSFAGLPVIGSDFTLTDGSSSVVSTTVELTTDYTASVDLGATAKEAFRFKVNNVNANEDAYVDWMRLYNSGSASDTDVANVTLYDKAGNPIATTTLNNRYAEFDLRAHPVWIEKGNFHTFSVKLDLKSGASRTVRLTFQENSDIKIRGANTGAYVLPAGVGSTDTTYPLGDTVNLLTVSSGSLSLSESGTPRANVAAGDSGISIGRFVLRPNGEDMELRQMRFGIIQTGATTLNSTVSVKVNGITVYSPDASAFTTATSFASTSTLGSAVTMNFYYTLPADKDAIVEIFGNIKSSATSGNSYGAALTVSQVKRISTNDLYSPSLSLVSSPARTVSSASLRLQNVVIQAGTWNVVKGASQTVLSKFTVDTSSSGEDVRINSFVVADTIGASSSLTDITNLKIYETNVTSSYDTSNNTSVVDSSGTTTFTFRNPIIIAKGSAIRTFWLKGDVSTGAAGGSLNTHKFDTVVSSDIIGNTNQGTADTISGSAQTVTIAAAGTLSVQVDYGNGNTYNQNDVTVVDTSAEQYTVFKFTAKDETISVTGLTLSATGTLVNTDFYNVSLYLNEAATPFATVGQSSGSSTINKTAVFSSSDKLFDVAPGATVYIRVKTDIAAQGGAKLGDTLRFTIAAAGDITAKGVRADLATSAITLGTQTSNYKQIVPFVVTISGVAPTSNLTQNISAGTVLGSFRVTNNSNNAVAITMGTTTINDLGTNSTTSLVYELWASDQNGVAPTGSALATTTKSSGVLTFASTSLFASTIQPGNYVTYSVRVNSASAAGLATNDTFSLYIPAVVGSVNFSVAESALTYDANVDGDSSDTINGLFVKGNPSLGTLTKSA